MRNSNALRKLMLVAALGSGVVSYGQSTRHPAAFEGYISGTDTVNNFYKDYVGVRLDVTAPTVIAGDKFYTAGTVAEGWGVATTPMPIVNATVSMPQYGDSCGCNAITNDMTGKVAVIWRGPLTGTGPCEFGTKVLNAQDAGAIACIIVNEYAGQGPVGMAPGTSGGTVHIPVYMVGNLDGVAMTQQYEDSEAVGDTNTMKITITPWGLELNNDLGFAPGGFGIGNNYAIPYTQLNGETVPNAYKNVFGGFVANYGEHLATHVKLADSVFWTPTGGSATLYNGQIDSETLASFPTTDSIWAFYGKEWNLGASATGMFTVNYHITSDTVDQFMFNNDLSYSFYATDSLFSKGTYDFADTIPVITQWYEPDQNNYLWGVPYYVQNSGSAAKSVQVSLSSGPGLLPNDASVNIIVFKWQDGSFGGAADSDIQTGELTVVGGGNYTFDGVTDSSFDIFNVPVFVGDSIVGGTGTFNVHPALDSQSWYIVAADVEGASMALGCDGILNAYPRTYFRYHATGYRELYDPLVDTDFLDLRQFFQAAQWQSYAFPGASNADFNANIGYSNFVDFPIDSIFYNGQIGLIPALPMWVTPNTDTGTAVDTNVSVKVVNQFQGGITVYPNPASDHIDVSLTLSAPVKNAEYIVLDKLGRTIARMKHENVQNETVTFTTSAYPAGNYSVIVFVDGKMLYKKFTVVGN